MNLLKEYIKKNSPVLLEKMDLFIHDTVPVYITEKVPENVSIRSVLNFLNDEMPEPLFKGLNAVYIGSFPEIEEEGANAKYWEGALYLVSKEQDGSMDLLDDIVHEVAHLVEEQYGEGIYEDEILKEEFLHKRNLLFERMSPYFTEDRWAKEAFKNHEYDKKLDVFFTEKVGNGRMKKFISGIFLTSYAPVSLNEYFADGFEHYFLGKREDLATLCPMLYKKIFELLRTI